VRWEAAGTVGRADLASSPHLPRGEGEQSGGGPARAAALARPPCRSGAAPDRTALSAPCRGAPVEGGPTFEGGGARWHRRDRAWRCAVLWWIGRAWRGADRATMAAAVSGEGGILGWADAEGKGRQMATWPREGAQGAMGNGARQTDGPKGGKVEEREREARLPSG
jgi:hypothetical protein